MFFGLGKQARRRRLAGAFPPAWEEILRDGFLYDRLLAPAEQARLRHAAHVLIVEKGWEGCAGQAITDEVQVIIAAQAALMLLGLEDYFFDELETVLVYPGSYLSVGDDELGGEGDVQMRLGEAAHGGPVALAWWHARWSGRRLADTNLVLHEFAHKLAELGDHDTSRPPFLDRSLWPRWDKVMRRERKRLAEDDDYARPTLLDPYGATNLQEFFAVATETFFLQPAELRLRHPDVYELLAACYRQEPAARPVPPDVAAVARDADEEHSRQAIRECSTAIKARPDYLDAYRSRADHRRALGDLDGTLADWAAFLAHPAADEGQRAEVLFDRAQLMQEEGRTDEALADLSEAVRLCPDYAMALAQRGHLRAERGEADAGLADLDEAVRLDPRDDLARRLRAAALRRAGRTDSALRDIDRAIRLYAHDPHHYLERARVRLAAGSAGEALADCDEAIRLDPEEVEAYEVRAEINQALGREDEARRDRETADDLARKEGQ